MPGLAKRRAVPSSAFSIAAELLSFFRNTRFCVPGASRMSNPWSRSQFTASSYVRLSVGFAICHLWPFDSRHQGAVAPQYQSEPIMSHICWDSSNITVVQRVTKTLDREIGTQALAQLRFAHAFCV